ncbi:hypothetical protein BJD99_01010 [Rhodococcus sp. 1163]|nr:hypothetical protein BJD99_01010 [Rhodococcus sp. 1163]
MEADIRSRAAVLIANTPRQIWELQQHVAPSHRRGEAGSGGGQHVKPTSRPPLSVDPIDAILDEQRELIRWSGYYGCTRGTVVQRVRHLLDAEMPDWDCENLVEAWGPIRSRIENRWPTDSYEPQWISERSAIEFVGRNKRTLRRWRASSPQIGRVGPLGLEYDKDSLTKVWHQQMRKAENSLPTARSMRRSA